MSNNPMEKIVSLCKRRGFIFPSSEIYGGLGGFWDAGPLGVELKNNIKKVWWQEMVWRRDDVLGLDSTIIHHPKVWQASGHAVSFTDPLVECKICHKRFRVDYVQQADEEVRKRSRSGGVGAIALPEQYREIIISDHKHEYTEVKQFNLMFKTSVGPVEDGGQQTYLRPETCQGIFINFANVLNSLHPKMPFGIAQIGKGFRNEITTGDFIFRDREFDMMELEYFVKPGEDEKLHDYWIKERLAWHQSLGLNKKNLRLFEHPKKSLAHYSKRTIDIEYQFPFGWAELEGIANRTDFDLKNHSKISGRDLQYQDEETEEKYYPYVIEPSLGVERMMLAVLTEAYQEEKDPSASSGLGRIVLKLAPKLSPYKVAVFPLVANKPELVKKAKDVYLRLKLRLPTVWDDRGNIGKRYYAQDEIGTPWCVTVDYQTLEDETVTIRDRDTTRQIRVKVEGLEGWFQTKLED